MARRVFGPSGSKRRRTRLLLLMALAASAFAVVFVTASSGTLSGGSTFESGDGNLVGTPTLHDWNPASGGNLGPVETITCPSTVPGSGTNCGLDFDNHNAADNALGQGAKEDDTAPTVVTGSIPPSKDDLSRFYVNKETVNNQVYLYLAWERSNLLGSAHMDFEFNQSSTPGPNGVTPVRTAGDLLIDFDFGGSGVPALAKHTWITSGTASTDCEASNTLPCWNKAVDLTAAGVSEGGVNCAPATDTNQPSAPRTLDGNSKNGCNSTFGEAGINLTAANIFPAGVCEHFGAAYLKSRSSGNAFGSELKDFIAPVPVNITNCGTVNIHKQDDVGAPLSGAVFKLFTDNAPVDGAPPHGAEDTVTSLTCTTNASGNCSVLNVPFGNYWAVETTGVPNHDTAADQSFSLTSNTPNLTISLTFVDPRQPGAILVTKTAKNASLGAPQPHPLAGAKFTVNGVQKTTDANGQACFDGLTQGTAYTVTEDSAPTGYSIDSTSKSVTPDHAASCTTGTPNGVTFTDKPLSDVSVTFVSNAGSGVTTGKINCGSGDVNLPDSTSTLVLDDKPEGTYNCTITIDP